MKLILTHYLDAEPARVVGDLEHAVVRGLGAAADRIGADRDDVVTEQVTEGIRVHHGLEILDGSELRVGGSSRLTVLQFFIPWTTDDGDGDKFLAANAFAHSVADGVAAAA